MKLKFLGGAGGVTGSKTILSIANENFLIDYGLFQGGSKIRELNWENHDLSNISAMILTHAHIDHSGLIPRLTANNFKGSIYCTKDTYKLCEILLEDSAHIHEEDAKYANIKNYSRHKPALPLYTVEDAKKILKSFIVVDFGQETPLSEHLSIKFHWAGHILGAAFVECIVNDNGKNNSIVFSGDVGHNRSFVLNGPEKLCNCDLLIMESTYGNKLHARTPAIDVLELYLNIILKRNGTAIIPSFSVGRTQEVLYLINRLMRDGKIPQVPVILDSPLSKKANKIFNQTDKNAFLKSELLECCESDLFPSTLREIETVQESKDLRNIPGPMIIISASGMIDGGRVVHHIKNRITDEKNGIILVGFQPVGTKGRLLLEGIETIRLHKEEMPVKATIFYINALSAHGDYLDLVEWLKSADKLPKMIILNHGEPASSNHLRLLLNAQFGITTTIADLGEEFNLVNL